MKAPVFKADKTDPFGISQTSVDFVVRGKPRPQYRDKPGWNRTRYNPSKALQEQFGRIAIEQCLNHADRVPDFGPNVGIRMEIHFCFPLSPKLVESKTLPTLTTYRSLLLMLAILFSMVTTDKSFVLMLIKLMTMLLVGRDTRE